GPPPDPRLGRLRPGADPAHPPRHPARLTSPQRQRVPLSHLEDTMKPLEGIRVIEVSMWGYVPSCGAALADWGATVIKVEPPEGDPMRGLAFGGVPSSPSGTSYMAELYNRGKRSVCLDLRHEQGLEILLRMVDS